MTPAVAMLLWPVSVLDVTQKDTSRVLWSVIVHDGSRIDLNYINSMYNAATTERFVVEAGRLRLIEVSSDKEAVLNYLGLQPPYRRRGERVVSERRGPVLAELTIRIGQTGQQYLVVDDSLNVPINQAGVGEAVWMRIDRTPRVRTLWPGSRRIEGP